MSQKPLLVTAPWKLIGTGNFNRTRTGDNQIDLLWHNEQTGEIQVWFMNSGEGDATDRIDFSYVQEQSNQTLLTVTAPWKLIGTGDFNSDGQSDLLWHNEQTGEIQVWFMAGINRTGFSYVQEQSNQTLLTVTAPWKLIGTGDFSFEQKSQIENDLLWHNEQTGEIQVWLMTGINRTSFSYVQEQSNQTLLTVTAPWKLIGTGAFTNPFNRGQDDLLWHNEQTGEVQVWFLLSTVRTGFNFIKEKST
jgi:hypothetical protein